MSLTDLFAPPFLVAAALLMLGGAGKAVRPDQAVRALSHAGLPSRRGVVRLMAVAETAVGAACLIAPGRALAAALAAMYFGFAVFLLRLMRADSPPESCGCVGSRSTPPSVVHVGLNLLACASGVASSVIGVPGITHVVPGGPMLAIPIGLGIVACAYAAYAIVVYVPGAWGSYRPNVIHDHGASPQVFTLSAGARP
jgi:hypothetical protein